MPIAASVTVARTAKHADRLSRGQMGATQPTPHHIHTPVEIRLNVMVFLVYTGWSQTRLCLYSKENGKAQRFVIFLNHSQRQPGGWMSTQSSAK